MKGKKPTLKQIHAIPCPTCGADPGEKCELNSGQPRTAPHCDRRLIAADWVSPTRLHSLRIGRGGRKGPFNRRGAYSQSTFVPFCTRPVPTFPDSVIRKRGRSGATSASDVRDSKLRARKKWAGQGFLPGLALSRASIRFSNSTDCAMSRPAWSIKSTAVSRSFSASRRSCSEVGLFDTHGLCHGTQAEECPVACGRK